MGDLSTQKSFGLQAPSPWKPWAIASVAAIVVLAVALGLMKALGLFEIPTDDPGAKTIAAALALVGAILATVGTLIGTVIKYSIDDRNARLAAIESHRTHALAIEAEQRNRIEAAIRAVDLLGANNKDATRHQIGGAILALVSLGELELAVSLLAELWPAGLTSPYVAENVLLKALESSSQSLTIAAATIVARNAERIDLKGHHIWPIKNVGWNVDLPLNARTALASSAATWMSVTLSRKRDQLPTALIALFKALKDPDFSVRDIAAASLRPLTKTFPQDWSLYTEDVQVSIADVLERLADFPAEPTTSYAVEAARKVQEVLAQSATER